VVSFGPIDRKETDSRLKKYHDLLQLLFADDSRLPGLIKSTIFILMLVLNNSNDFAWHLTDEGTMLGLAGGYTR
jgi:hypothetical protein